jgi:hypothetical protein
MMVSFAVAAAAGLAACTGRIEPPRIDVDDTGAPIFEATIHQQDSTVGRVQLAITDDGGTTWSHNSEERPNPFQVSGDTYRYGPETAIDLTRPGSWVVSRWDVDFNTPFTPPHSHDASVTLVDLDLEEVRLKQNGTLLPSRPGTTPGDGMVTVRPDVPLTIEATVRNSSPIEFPHSAIVRADAFVSPSSDVLRSVLAQSVSGMVTGPIPPDVDITIDLPPLAMTEAASNGVTTIRVSIETLDTNWENDQQTLVAVWQP